MRKFEKMLKSDRRELEVTIKLGELEDAIVDYFNETRNLTATSRMDLINIIHTIISIDSIKKAIEEKFPEKEEKKDSETEFMTKLLKTMINIMEGEE